MNLEEKIGQLCQVDGRKDYERWIHEKHIGSFLHVYDDRISVIQESAKKTRLGIPVLFGIDAIHGNAFVPGATVFPSQLGLSCSWNLALIEEMASITAKEVSLCGIHWSFSPVLCIARDTRWGRVDETFGEDIFLIGEMGKAMVRGYQGKAIGDQYSILACAKHFAGYSETQGGRDASEADLSVRKLRSGFLPAFEEAVKAGCRTVMVAYQAIDGVPCTANSWLLNDVLKKEWGFNGIAISDWNNIGRMVSEQFVCSSLEGAVAKAIASGTDMSMATPDFPDALLACVKNKSVKEEDIDRIVERVLGLKFELGLFDGKKIHPDKSGLALHFGSALHREKALECAIESCVLLKNDGAILPIGDSIKRIAVIGPNAFDRVAQLGDWSLHSAQLGVSTPWHSDEHIVTVLEGLRRRSGDGISVSYCKGCSVTDDGYDEIAEAKKLASESDIAILVLGDTTSLNGETRDRATLELTGKQEELFRSVRSTGTPVITVLVTGKPLCIASIKEHSNAIIEAWNPGMEGGTAVAKIIFGDVNPSGRLTISFPRHSGQIPVYYDQVPGWHAFKYADLPDGKPLFPFGYGLSYTSFSYSGLSVSRNKLRIGENLAVCVDVENTGLRDGIEIVQLYVRDLVSSVTMPVKRLKGFSRVFIRKGERKRVELNIGEEALSLVNAECKKVVEPGFFEIMVGGSSEDEALLRTKIEVVE